MRSYAVFCLACGLPVRFSFNVIADWLADYCREGYTARSLPNRLSKLRRHARSQRAFFPAADSDEGLDLKDLITALTKLDPTDPQRATVVSLDWLMRVAAALGISALADCWTCQPWQLQLLSRALVAHCCMMRGCEHRSGLRVGDIGQIDVDVITLYVAARYSEKKLKLRPARVCVLPVSQELHSAGGVLLIYLARLRVGCGADALLFPRIGLLGDVDELTPQTDAQFLVLLKQQLTAAHMQPHQLLRVSNHSLRAGGATDWSVDMPADFIGAQGGWASPTYLIYIRPADLHRQRTARAMAGAARQLLRTGVRGESPWQAPWVGRQILKTFDGRTRPFEGVVVSADVERGTGCPIYRVRYDDGDWEDLYSSELAPLAEAHEAAALARRSQAR